MPEKVVKEESEDDKVIMIPHVPHVSASKWFISMESYCGAGVKNSLNRLPRRMKRTTIPRNIDNICENENQDLRGIIRAELMYPDPGKL